MSAMPSSGLVGVSTQTSLVWPGVIAAPDRVDVGQRDRGVRDAPALDHLVEQAVGAAVRVVGDHHVVARVEQRPDQGVLGGQPGGEREARARRSSSAARLPSSAVRVGLAERLYS